MRVQPLHIATYFSGCLQWPLKQPAEACRSRRWPITLLRSLQSASVIVIIQSFVGYGRAPNLSSWLRTAMMCRTKYYGVHLGEPDLAATPFKDEPLTVHR